VDLDPDLGSSPSYLCLPRSFSWWLPFAEVVFNSAGNVIYGLQLEQEVDEESKFETSFKTFDAGDYSIIATTETKKSILGLCPSWDDLTLAVVEQVLYCASYFFNSVYSVTDV
jgi:hypothetical protein